MQRRLCRMFRLPKKINVIHSVIANQSTLVRNVFCPPERQHPKECVILSQRTRWRENPPDIQSPKSFRFLWRVEQMGKGLFFS